MMRTILLRASSVLTKLRGYAEGDSISSRSLKRLIRKAEDEVENEVVNSEKLTAVNPSK